MLETFESRILFSGETGLRADYYNAPTDQFSAQSAAVNSLPAVTETDQGVNFDWKNTAPVSGVNSSGFEVRWSGQVLTQSAGVYKFSVQANSNVRLFVNGQLVVNDWTSHNGTDTSAGITLAANTLYDIRLDYYQPAAASENNVSLMWQTPGSSTSQVISAANLYPFSKATAFTTGGIYVGSWEGSDSNGVTLEDSTMQPVTIADSIIRSSGTLISDTLAGVQLTVTNSYGYGLNPNVAGVEKGSFLYLMSPASVDVEHNSIIGVGGLGTKIYGFVGTGSQTIKIDYNDILNSDGRFSDGNGGYENDGIMTHSIQLANIYNLAGVDIGWNRIINQPGQSYVNDVINIFDTSGTASSPINVHDNYVDGLYSLQTASVWNSGSGITTDGDPDISKEPAYVNIHNNTVIQAGSAGIGVPDGHNILVYNNYLVCSGYLPDGSAFFASGTGIYINDLSGGNSSIFYGNGAYNNTVGWIQPPHSQQNGENFARPSDFSLPNADSTLVYGNVDLDLAGPITTATENAAGTAWLSQLAADNFTVGAVLPTAIVAPTVPTVPTTPTTPTGPTNPTGSTGLPDPIIVPVPAPAPVPTPTPTPTPTPVTPTGPTNPTGSTGLPDPIIVPVPAPAPVPTPTPAPVIPTPPVTPPTDSTGTGSSTSGSSTDSGSSSSTGSDSSGSGSNNSTNPPTTTTTGGKKSQRFVFVTGHKGHFQTLNLDNLQLMTTSNKRKSRGAVGSLS